MFLSVFAVRPRVKVRLSVRMSDAETVTPHAVVGYCILWRLASTQDVSSELLGRLFFLFHSEVDRLFPCSLFLHVCV